MSMFLAITVFYTYFCDNVGLFLVLIAFLRISVSTFLAKTVFTHFCEYVVLFLVSVFYAFR